MRVTSPKSEIHHRNKSYELVGSGGGGRVKHDGDPVGSYQTKESAFEAAVAAVSLAVREGYEVQLSVPGLASNPNRHREAKRAAGVTRAETGSTSPIMSAHSRNPPKLIEQVNRARS